MLQTPERARLETNAGHTAPGWCTTAVPGSSSGAWPGFKTTPITTSTPGAAGVEGDA